ncbi:hypothetical protein JOC70_000081 [Clostridium pascui]|nr:hypothetical protein [Clostridium pascui]
MIFIFIIYKNLDWFGCLLHSLMMTILIIIYTEVAIIYKEIKKEYSMNTSPDESDSR